MTGRFALLAGVVLAFLPAGLAAPAARPNIVLILADDLGWSDIGCYGSEIQTPRLDALAREGVRFTQFYNCARCCPSRASLLTGLYPQQAGVGSMNSDRGPEYPGYRGALQPDTATLAEVLRDAGYKTYMVGKWHLRNDKFDVKPTDRGFDEFYGMLGGYNSCWHEHPYYTRWPKDRSPRTYTSAKGDQPGTFYSTDAFADYSLDFIADARAARKPFFLYLAFNAVHFPLHAPEADIAKYEAMYFAKGWDTLREERLARQKAEGLVPADLALTPRSLVPPKSFAKASPFAGKPSPAWASLPEDRRRDLARRMAVYAAMTDRMDQAIGRVVDDLKQHGQLDNTLIMFLSDNGADWEWDPYGFDENSGPKNVLHTGAEVKRIGGPASYVSYGSAWAGASNTPWRYYKHFDYEGGTRTPFIVSWPAGLKARNELRTQVGHIMDLMPTLVEVAGATYPAVRQGVKVQPMEGRSLVPALENRPLVRAEPLFFEHEGSRAARAGDWKLVSLAGAAWELFYLKDDPSEMTNLMAAQPERARELIGQWEAWAKRCHVDTTTDLLAHNLGVQEISSEDSLRLPTPQIANRALVVTCEVTPASPAANGVVLAQGGQVQGYALHLEAGVPVFSVRENRELVAIKAPAAPAGTFSLAARLEADGKMTLAVNGAVVATGKTAGLIPAQPMDELSVGRDVRTAVGNYAPPHPLAGKVEKVDIQTKAVPAASR